MTPRQRAALHFIADYRLRHGGVSPTYREIAKGIGISSAGRAYQIVSGLEDLGLVRRLRDHARTVEPVGAFTPERAFLAAADALARELRRHHGVEAGTREAFLAAWQAWRDALGDSSDEAAQHDLEDYTGRAV